MLFSDNKVTKALTANNYSANFIHNSRHLYGQQRMTDTNQHGLVILPYAKGFSERVTKVL